jgi:serine/threonine protein kinase
VLLPLCCLQLKLLCRLKEVAQALQYLHARHVVHGDLKVANVLLAADPTAPFGKTAKVTDFGLSRALQVGAWGDGCGRHAPAGASASVSVGARERGEGMRWRGCLTSPAVTAAQRGGGCRSGIAVHYPVSGMF